jgi:hypothetical protein
MLRFIVPNRYTFGYITINDLITEITDSRNVQNTSLYDLEYAKTLSNFNSAYNQSNVFGANLIPSYNGISIVTSNFRQFMSTFNSNYTVYQSNMQILNTINEYVNSNTYIYISTQLKNFFPIQSINSNQFTSPIIFSILWSSSLLPHYSKLIDNWGLGYTLGYTKNDTPFSLLQQATSFYKILEDYIYLKVSPEYNINTIDITDKENLNLTRDSTGSIGQYFGKLLLGDFNTYSRTFVSNQVTFNPPIARLDKLSFEWYDSTGVLINNNDCDWNASFTITEYTMKSTVDSTLIKIPAVSSAAAPAVVPPIVSSISTALS